MTAHRAPLTFDTETGLVTGSAVRRSISPNRGNRPDGEAIELLVIHNISLPPGIFEGDAVERLFHNRLDANEHPYYRQLIGVEVSAHFFIRRNGSVVQFVPCHERAWHAGQSEWQHRTRCNDFSIGIELEGADDVPYTEPQYESLSDLTVLLESQYPIRGRVGHCDIAPDRKTDPGPSFDWAHYTRLTEQKSVVARHPTRST